jgi:stage II sporulation protein D
VLALTVVWLAGAGMARAASRDTIRVALWTGETALSTVRVAGPLRYESDGHGGTISGAATVGAERGHLVLRLSEGARRLGTTVRLTSPESRPVQVEGGHYRGEMRVDLQSDGKLRVVNTLDFDDYVRGVVPNEMFADDEAYQVQAIIARTYALYVRDVEKKHQAEKFDVCVTGHCQVYRGLDTETPMSDEAVAATRGQVLTRRGRVIFSAYGTNAGGETVQVDEAWPGSIRQAFQYLPNVDSPYDTEAQHLPGYEWCWEWRQSLAPETIKSRLGARGERLGRIRDLVVTRRNHAGRVSELRVVGDNGSVTVSGPPEVRNLLGTPSGRLDISRGGATFQLHGYGYGDGVGLSQHGALGMARAGYDHESILAHYYRDVEVSEDFGRGASHPLRSRPLSARRAEASDRRS